MARNNGKTGDKKTVTDLKRGMAVDDHQVPVDGNGADTSGDNSFEPQGETIQELLELAREAEKAIAEEEEKKRLAAKPFNDKIKAWKDKVKEARDQLVSDGYPTLELNVLLAEQKDQLKAARRRDELDPVQKKRLARMDKAFREFASIPGGLGEAALRREAELQH